MVNPFRTTVLSLALSAATLADDTKNKLPTDLAGNEAVKQHIEGFKGRGEVGDFNTKPLSPEESLKTFKIAEGLTVETVLHEPTVVQPLAIDFDERGRMWVVQYKQYPFPAGLKIVKYDEHLRAVFDKVPQPPGHPDHVKGADEITIHEDTDGDGKYDKHKTFISGLNIATSVAHGRGGVWVANPPYLLFYADKNNDDVPDGPPEVHLRGFGLEDTHAVMNSLKWGPDGWLYGAQGSTCWATVSSEVTKDVHFKGQAIWRYHPETKVFEVFAEGGGNTFCVEFDSKGRCYSGTNWGALRGVHYVQGGRYIKGWGKHGPLMNPYSFGWFEHMPHEGYQPRFSHSLIVYEGGAIPMLEGKMVSIIPLHNRIQVSEMVPWGSTFKTKDTIAAVESKDRWFRPVDIKAGPDGAIYVADWYDTRLTHVDPRDNWDKTHGRIYRISAKAASRPNRSVNGSDLSKLKTEDLIARLSSPNKWERQTIQRILADRKEAEHAPALLKAAQQAAGQHALELTYALFATTPADPQATRALLAHGDAHVRRWAVRHGGDCAGSGLCPPLYKVATEETDLEVLSQLASSTVRTPYYYAVLEMARRDDLANDPHIPLLLWWALESKDLRRSPNWLTSFGKPENWKHPIISQTLLPRLVQKFVTDPTPANLAAAATILDAAPSAPDVHRLIKSVEEATKGGVLPDGSPDFQRALSHAISRAGGAGDTPSLLLLRAGDAKTHDAVLSYIGNDDPNVKAKRIELIDALGQIGKPEAVQPLLKVATTSQWHSVRRAALAALARFSDAKIGEELVVNYSKLPADQGVRPRTIDTLTKRKEWSLALMKAVEAGQVPRGDIAFEQIERMKLHKDEALAGLIRKQWGVTRATAEEKLKKMEAVRSLLMADAASGDEKKGKVLFTTTCAVCHKLHDTAPAGNVVLAPDLTGYERDNLDYLLLAIIDPSAAIREEFVNYEIETKDGLLLTGFLLDQNPKTVTIQDGVEGKVTLLRSEIVSLKASASSRMPEQLLDTLKPQDLRDLFAYLKSKKPVK